MTRSFPQLFPPLPIPVNCYSDLKAFKTMYMEVFKPKHNRLIFYRRRMGFTQKQVSQLLGHRDTSMVSHYEHGRSLPPLLVALRLEIILRAPVAFLFPGLYDDLKRRIRDQEEHAYGSGRPLPLKTKLLDP